MVLNTAGGPTYINFTADAPVVISEDKTEFYKQPMFYALGHFSKFVIPGSVRINAKYQFTSSNKDNVQVLAFQRPDNLKAIIVFNK